jgi:DeoR/GlpR family transcriptional regulator of sugar metabolism
VIVVADAGKFAPAGGTAFLRWRDVDELVTDRRADARAVADIRRGGVKVTRV